MANNIRSATASMVNTGSYDGLCVLSSADAFDVGATVSITSTVYPQPNNLVILAKNGSILTLGLPNGGGLANLSQYFCPPIDTVTVQQSAGPGPGSGGYNIFPGTPGQNFYGNFGLTLGPDVGSSAVGSTYWSLAALADATTGDALIWVAATAGYNAPAWGASQVIQASMQRASGGNVYVALNSGTTNSGQTPTGTTTFTGTDGITWQFLATATPATFTQIGIK